MNKTPKEVQIFEVGPRDGLQNEKVTPSLEEKIRFIEDLALAGLQNIECGAFVRAEKVPQMADTDQLLRLLGKNPKVKKLKLWSLVPNLKGLERAIEVGAERVAVFTAATETFNQRNIGMSIAESLDAIQAVIKVARKNKIAVRGYVSTVYGCPFEGPTPPQQALKVIEKLAKMGVDQISIGDTIGVATPKGVDQVIKPLVKYLSAKRVAVHFHDTRGTALANTLRSLEYGVKWVDSSAGGLGGCPYAPGATGNLATEDLVYMLNGMGVKTGVNLEKLCEASLRLHAAMNRPIVSRYLRTYEAQK